MSGAQTQTEIRFEPPGPGSWELDAVHFPRPVTRYWAEIHPAAFKRGVSDFTSFYGMLLDSLNMEYINGFAYKSAQPVSAEEVPARLARAEELFQGKLWREQLKEWDDTVKPASIKTDRELQAIDPDELSDEDLAAYLRRCHDHHAAMIAQHMRFTAARDGAHRRLSRARRRLDRPAGVRAAGPDARRRARLGGSIGRARSAGVRRRRRCRGPAAAGVRRGPGRDAAGAALAGRRRRQRRQRLSRPGRLAAARRLRHLRAVRARAARRAACGRCEPPSPSRVARTRTSSRRSPMCAPRSPRSAAASSTSCSPRPG